MLILSASSEIFASKPDVKELLSDLIGQSSLLAPNTFAKAFLAHDEDSEQDNFILYGWKEAIEEGLEEKYSKGGERLWRIMVTKFPEQFSGGFPHSTSALAAVLQKIKTKQDREEEWAEKNAPAFRPKLLAKLKEPGIDILLPAAMWGIIFEYAVTGATWVDV